MIVAGIGIMVAVVMTACSGKKGRMSERVETMTGNGSEEGKQAAGAKEAGAAEQTEAVYVKLKPEEAKERIDSGDEVVIVDVRTPEEYGETHIGNAINIPLESIGREKPEQLPDVEAEIMVYCRSGVRSKKAAQKLLEMGYKNIEDIGGIIDWPYETVAGDE